MRHIQTTEILLPFKVKVSFPIFFQWEQSQLFWGAFSIHSLQGWSHWTDTSHVSHSWAHFIGHDSAFHGLSHLLLKKREEKEINRKCDDTHNSCSAFRHSIIIEPRAVAVLVSISFLGLQYSNCSQYHYFVAELNIQMACSRIVSSLGIQNYSSQ